MIRGEKWRVLESGMWLMPDARCQLPVGRRIQSDKILDEEAGALVLTARITP